MTRLRDEGKRVVIGHSGTFTRKKCSSWHEYQKRDRRIHHTTLSDKAIIPGPHANLFSAIQALQEGLQVTSEGKALILKKNSTKIRFVKEMANNSGKEFILTTNFYKNPNNAVLLVPKKRKLEATAENQQEKTATKKQVMLKFHVNKLHMNLGPTR